MPPSCWLATSAKPPVADVLALQQQLQQVLQHLYQQLHWQLLQHQHLQQVDAVMSNPQAPLSHASNRKRLASVVLLSCWTATSASPLVADAPTLLCLLRLLCLLHLAVGAVTYSHLAAPSHALNSVPLASVMLRSWWDLGGRQGATAKPPVAAATALQQLAGALQGPLGRQVGDA